MAGAIGVLSGKPGVGAAEGGPLSVVVEGELVSIEARDAPLADVLRAIGEHAGVAVVIKGDAGPTVSVSLAEVPLGKALRRLLRDTASAAIYERSAGRLVEVQVRLLADRAGALSGAAAASPTDGMHAGGVAELRVAPYELREDRLALVRHAAGASGEHALEELATLLLEDDDAGIRGSAAAALGRLRDDAAREALTAALDDPDAGVRRAATRALGAFGGEQAVETLGRVLVEERAPAVRQMAAWALSHMSSEAALEALAAARRDRDRDVRAIVEAALARTEE